MQVSAPFLHKVIHLGVLLARPPLKKNLFLVQQVVAIVASRVAAIFFFFFFFFSPFGRKILSIFFEKKNIQILQK